MSNEFYLSGKDYLTEAEAAHYACVSLSGFRKKFHVPAFRIGGKKVFRRQDVQAAIEGEMKPWQPSTQEGKHGISNGLRVAGKGVKA